MSPRPYLMALGLAGWLSASTPAADDIEGLTRGPGHQAEAAPRRAPARSRGL